MPRYALTIEYDGTPFVGWQMQADGVSVQGELQRAVHACSSEKVAIRGAGRTDSGVHARGQVAHFDLEKPWPPWKLREALNYHLRPSPISVLDCQEVLSEFDARFTATARHYLYRLLCRPSPPAIDINRVWWVRHSLDAQAMGKAAQCLVGRHDFTTFRASACQAGSPIKTLDRLHVEQRHEEVRIYASARSFLHHQVRSMVGSLKHVGEGKWNGDDIHAALQARDRARCGVVAPACGLYLMRVDYPVGALPS